MKNLITLKSYDNSYTRAINPDHIVSFFEVDGDSCIKLSNGETFTTKMQFYDLVESRGNFFLSSLSRLRISFLVGGGTYSSKNANVFLCTMRIWEVDFHSLILNL